MLFSLAVGQKRTIPAVASLSKRETACNIEKFPWRKEMKLSQIKFLLGCRHKTLRNLKFLLDFILTFHKSPT